MPNKMFDTITDVKGIQCWGAHIGIKSKRRDLGLIYSEVPGETAAVFTQNLVAAEPVKVSRELAKKGKKQLFVINAGNANACTGQQGRQGAEAMVTTAADALDLKKERILIASTGVIGRRFPTEKVVKGIKKNIKKLSGRSIAGSLVANAILTTDTFPKEGFLSFKVGGQKVSMAGVAKGSGMIHPDMGTMLAFIVCDINISKKLLDSALKNAVDKTFNMITVDGDTSTNDMASILCNGMAGNEKITSPQSKDYQKFKEKLEEMCLHLAQLIVSDGEGATKLVEYKVINAPTENKARQIVRTVSDSSLVKTALYGRDPNWGRILAAAGRSGVEFDPEKVSLHIGGASKAVQLVQDGQPTDQSLTQVKQMLRASHIHIIIDLNAGDAEATGWGTDFSYEYVRINAEYTS